MSDKPGLPCQQECKAFITSGTAANDISWMCQVLGASLEAHVAASDNSALAKDCRRDIKATNAALLKLSRKVMQRLLLPGCAYLHHAGFPGVSKELICHNQLSTVHWKSVIGASNAESLQLLEITTFMAVLGGVMEVTARRTMRSGGRCGGS